MEWMNDRVIDLIKLYEKHVVLWDSTNKFYKINNKKNDAWKEISQELNLDVQEIKRKITSLLATYRKARQKVAQNNRSGMGTDELYSPWFAFKHFHFLHTKYQPKETINTEVRTYIFLSNYKCHLNKLLFKILSSFKHRLKKLKIF